MLGEGLSVDLHHLGHDIFDRFGRQVREGRICFPVRSVSKTLDERLQAEKPSPPVSLRRETSVGAGAFYGGGPARHLLAVCRRHDRRRQRCRASSR